MMVSNYLTERNTMITFNKSLVFVLSCGFFLGLTACQSMPTIPKLGKKPLKPESIYVADIVLGKLETLDISMRREPCNSKKPMQCMLVKIDNKFIKIPYNGIKGFRASPNKSYKITAYPLIDKNYQQATGQWQLKEILQIK